MLKNVHYKIFEIIILILVYILELQQLMAWSHFNHYCHQIYVENEKSILFFHFDWATSCSFGICFGFYICFCNWLLWWSWIMLGNSTFKGNFPWRTQTLLYLYMFEYLFCKLLQIFSSVFGCMFYQDCSIDDYVWTRLI